MSDDNGNNGRYKAVRVIGCILLFATLVSFRTCFLDNFLDKKVKDKYEEHRYEQIVRDEHVKEIADKFKDSIVNEAIHAVIDTLGSGASEEHPEPDDNATADRKRK